MSAERTQTLSELLIPERILLECEAANKKRVFEQVGLAFENSGGPQRTLVFKRLLERERLGSTVIGGQAAIPHARIKGLRRPLAAFVRTSNPFAFDAPSAMVRFMFFLLAPEKADGSHLSILSMMSRLLTDPAFADGIGASGTGGELLAQLRSWEADAASPASKRPVATG